MIPKRYFPSIVCGFGAAVLSSVPDIKSLSCCLIVPAAAFLSLHLYVRSVEHETPLKLNRALSFGLVTGLIAALFTTLFDLLITYVTHSNELVTGLQYSKEFMEQFNPGPVMKTSFELMDNMVKEIQQNGFSALYTVMIVLSNGIIFSIFGMLGGLLAMAIHNRRHRPNI
ncbi:MAG: DUF4199 domain-containing protein [Ignavibacteria bacterium]|jgi:hypothetical protein